MSKSFAAIFCFCLLLTNSVDAQTFGELQGYQQPDRILPSTTVNRIFQKPPSKFGKSDFEGSAETQGVTNTEGNSETSESITQSTNQDTDDREREGASVTTSLGITSKTFPFNTSASVGSNKTYLRLINPESFSNEVTISIYSINSANLFEFQGNCFISVPGKSAPQLGNDYFEDCINWSPSSSETSMFLHFDIGEYLYWQNIIWSPTTGYFGNLSTCREPTVSDQFVHNVHTTRISAYPSTLFGLVDVFENYHVDINLYNSGNGDLVGQYRSQLFAQNTTVLGLKLSDIESLTTWYVPFANRPYQVNLEFDLVNQFGTSLTQGAADLVSHYVQQTSREETYNMLNSCSY